MATPAPSSAAAVTSRARHEKREQQDMLCRTILAQSLSVPPMSMPPRFFIALNPHAHRGPPGALPGGGIIRRRRCVQNEACFSGVSGGGGKAACSCGGPHMASNKHGLDGEKSGNAQRRPNRLPVRRVVADLSCRHQKRAEGLVRAACSHWQQHASAPAATDDGPWEEELLWGSAVGSLAGTELSRSGSGKRTLASVRSKLASSVIKPASQPST
ncbi:hypothetical protein DCS_01289 [Drechmeria coniospora]|uniref:Uncharacterized protein n=1 Tax=Drechmeria coniospora TaxID=98403 RepID=A0A151GSQ6_DRECN|nr:hypothetical protein DCS_01289 [Drechmeria coniospora]KYK60154.1 hypothetical protein DCS_01289 [Drechmeria coniospora]ODA81405.1 hypothetical protein RJ55_04370 [Drechmeria coniospora]